MTGRVKVMDIRSGWFWTDVVVEAVEDCWKIWYNVAKDGPYHTHLDAGKRKVLSMSNSRCIWTVGDIVPADDIL